MDSYRIFQYLRVLWIFIFGFILVLYGVYMLFSFGEVGFYTMGASFWVMLIGLLLTGVGSIYGKKKLHDPNAFRPRRARGGLGMFMAPPQVPQASQPVQQVQPAQPQSQPQGPPPYLQQAPTETRPNPMRPVLQGAEKRVEADVKKVATKFAHVASSVASKAASYQTSGTQAQAAQPPQERVKVVKVLICPKCGTENQESDRFCFNCGKKLRMSGARKS